MQLLTVGELLDGKGIDYPRTAGVNQTFKQAPKEVRKVAEASSLFELKLDLTHFGGHLNRSDYGSEQEVCNGQKTTGIQRRVQAAGG